MGVGAGSGAAAEYAFGEEMKAKQREHNRAEGEKKARMKEAEERGFAEAIAAFVKDDFLSLTSVEGKDRFGGEGLDRNTNLLDLLNRAAEKLRARKDLNPRIEAELCWIVGVNYRGAGEAAKGLPFLEQALQLRSDLLGREHEDTLVVMNSLAVAYLAAGRTNMALPLHEETLRLWKARNGPEDAQTLPCPHLEIALGGCWLAGYSRDLTPECGLEKGLIVPQLFQLGKTALGNKRGQPRSVERFDQVCGPVKECLDDACGRWIKGGWMSGNPSL